MAKRTKEPTAEEILESNLKEMMQRIKFVPEPTYFFKVGEEVVLGNLPFVHVVKMLENGKIYLIEHSIAQKNTKWENGKPVQEVTYEGGHQRYVFWLDIRPKNDATESLIRNDNIYLSFSQRSLDSLFGNVYFFGTEMDPDYQRDYCWTMEDKVALIDSIFNNVDIGKFVFVHNDYGDKYLYEILDGKQRLRTILDYYENRFPYKGRYFNDLCGKDKDWFCRKNIAVAEVSKSNKKEILRYFIMLNTAGKSMDKEHLAKVLDMYKECE